MAAAEFDVLKADVLGATVRGMFVIPELLHPLFNYAWNGKVNYVAITNMPQDLAFDHYGRTGSETCTNNPEYRHWWQSLIEDQCRSYPINGIMGCNERRSALDQMVCCQTPGCICEHCRRESMAREIEVEPMRKAFLTVRDYFQQARAGDVFVDVVLIEFLRVLFANPELLIWDTNYLKDATGLLALKGYVYRIGNSSYPAPADGKRWPRRGQVPPCTSSTTAIAEWQSITFV